MKVCIFWGSDVFQKPWDYLLMSLDISRDDVYIVADPDYEASKSPAASTMTGSSNIIEKAEYLPPGPLVVASPLHSNHLNGTTPLYEFVHPEDAIYVFGADNISLHPQMFGEREIDYLVYVPTSGRDLFSHLAGAMVLYDRRCKQA